MMTFPEYVKKTHFVVDERFTRNQKDFDIIDCIALCVQAPATLEVYDDLLDWARMKLRSLNPLEQNVRDQLNFMWGGYTHARDYKPVEKPKRRPLFD